MAWIRFSKKFTRQNGVSESLADAYVQFGKATNTGIMYGDYMRKPEHTTPTSLESFVNQELVPAYQHS